jgi:hypothetical protein
MYGHKDYWFFFLILIKCILIKMLQASNKHCLKRVMLAQCYYTVNSISLKKVVWLASEVEIGII